MQALYTAAPGQYGLVERPLPVPAPDEALLRVAAAGLCHTDVIIREGTASHVRYPVVPGHEFSGVVAEVGAGVRSLRPGDRVAMHTIVNCGQCRPCRRGLIAACEQYDECGSKRDGGFAEYVAVPARCLYRVAGHLSLAEAALAEPAANAHSVVRQAEVRQGDRVVVIGPGPIGLLALQFARLRHPSLLVLVGTRDQRLALGRRLGATHTVNLTRAGALAELRALLGAGADAVLECAGTRGAVELALELAGPFGRVAIEGVLGAEETVPLAPHTLLVKGMRLIGILGWHTSDFTGALEHIESGLVDVKPLITHRLPLAQWETAFDLVTARKSEAIKVEFTFAGVE